MRNPVNRFKSALADGERQLGIWNTVGGNTVPELLGGSGFNWVLVDCEHAAIETVEVLPALQAIGQNPDTSAVVRVAANDPTLFKRVLDMGAQSVMVPYVQTAEEAEAAVDAMHYGPKGMRGMAGMTRATRYGKVDDYFTSAEEQLYLIVQVETIQGLANLRSIARTDGVDAVFIGPADLSASMGLTGQMAHPDVDKAVSKAITDLVDMGVPAGVMALDPDVADRYLALGATFVAVAVDLVLLADAVAVIHKRFN
ncbi:HpcH/HpaI aldolase family protein [Octadecabacter ascidiaceicola]|uniref:4-hydroxy-2-oxovalerate aldolase n=1 Tax=Octadecabacter ascidiaceicola TaxID=1655543 RepID=A0A238KHT1_9RHOB|nr:aldolase/citrate lyase family protein [Octadecabacter ascidiaceicola]SMX42258.1 4-hydroxy-2-oxovalerate aldolase [Octadecabacter ascidiaceicola]